MRDIYLIDFENVASEGLNGITYLAPEDEVIIFYSNNSKSLSMKMHILIGKSVCKLDYFEAAVGGKNALDHQISTWLGYLIGTGAAERNYYIVSRDMGYKFVASFWSDSELKPRVRCVESIKAASRMERNRQLQREAAEKPTEPAAPVEQPAAPALETPAPEPAAPAEPAVPVEAAAPEVRLEQPEQPISAEPAEEPAATEPVEESSAELDAVEESQEPEQEGHTRSYRSRQRYRRNRSKNRSAGAASGDAGQENPVPEAAAPQPAPEPEVKPDPKPEVKPAAKPEPKLEVKPAAKPEPKSEVKPAVKPEPAPEVREAAAPVPEAKPEPKQQTHRKAPHPQKKQEEPRSGRVDLSSLLAPYPGLQESHLQELIAANKRQVLCNTLRKQLGQEKGLALYNEIKKSAWR